MVWRRLGRHITAMRYWVWLKTGWGTPPVYTPPANPVPTAADPVLAASMQFIDRTGHPVILWRDDRGWKAETAVAGREMSVSSASYSQCLRQLREMVTKETQKSGKKPA